MPASSTSSSRTPLLILAAVVALAALFFILRGCNSQVLEVRAATAQNSDLITTVSTNGKVEPAYDFSPRAPQSGTVNKVFVTVNQHVVKGQQLLLLDDTDARRQLAAAIASLRTAQDGLTNMRRGGSTEERLNNSDSLTSARQQQQQAATALASLQKLEAAGAASPNEVQRARQSLAAAQLHVSQLSTMSSGRYSGQDVSTQQAQVTQAQVAVAAAQSGLDAVDIRAPFEGTVYALPVHQYDFVQAGDVLVSVADLNHLQVRAFFDEPDIGKLATGEPVAITWDARPEQSWVGHVLQPPTTITEYNTRNVGQCLISVDPPDEGLIPHTNVIVRVRTSQKFNVLSIPREALHTLSSANFVFVIDHGQLVSRPVQVGSVNLTRVEITSGIKSGDVVALPAVNNSDLAAGQRVKVVE
jgi:HlyD family secretion protein